MLEADHYHAGRRKSDRNRVQRLFMGGKLRIVVATVAFGMGIHKVGGRVAQLWPMAPTTPRMPFHPHRGSHTHTHTHTLLTLLSQADVRAVIHYSLPRSLESYTQEVGRAGRDDAPAYCHAFLAEEDYTKLRSLSHGDMVDGNTISALTDMIFGSKAAAAGLPNADGSYTGPPACLHFGLIYFFFIFV